MSTRAPRVGADEARRRIIGAFGTLLRERRYRDVTVDEVMSEAGLSRTVFYRHFDGLAGIVVGLLDELLGGVVAEADQTPEDREVLRRQLALVVRMFREHGPLLLALDDAARQDAEVERIYKGWHDHSVAVSTELVQRGIDRGHTPPMPVADVVRALTDMNGYYLLDLVAHGPDFDEEAALEALWTVWSRVTWPIT